MVVLAPLAVVFGPRAGSVIDMVRVLDRSADGQAILIRSPQPDPEDLRELHQEFGVRTVINLRGEEVGREWYEEEVRAIAAIGARQIDMRVSGSKPTPPEQVDRFFDIVEDPSNWPVMIHCWGGSHRTGALSALYRIQHQGWSNAAAVEEMEAMWFDWSGGRDRSRLKAFIRAYQPDPVRQIDRDPEPLQLGRR